MIDADAALAIADEHVAAVPRPLDGYRVVHHEPLEVDEGWYFDYGIECELDIPLAERELFAGAPGFIVARDSGEVRIVPHDEWALRRFWQQ